MQKTYTQEEILVQLKDLAEELGRTPGGKDIEIASKQGKIASIRTLYKHLGSLTNAQMLAGLPLNKGYHGRHPERKYTKAQLISQLQLAAKSLGRPPSIRDVDGKEFELACSGTFVSAFGSYTNALRAAGFGEIQKRLSFQDRDEKQLFEFLQAAAKTLSLQFTISEFDRFASSQPNGCGPATLIKYFGTLKAAFDAAGVEVIVLSRDEAFENRQEQKRLNYIKALQEYVARVGYIPSIEQMKRAYAVGDFDYGEKIPYRLFGSWPKAVVAAGYQYELRVGPYLNRPLAP